MKREEYIQKVLAPFIPYNDKIDEAALLMIANQVYDEGYSIEDAIASMKFTEHANPDLDEEYACAEMAKIARKYNPYLRQK